MPDTTPTPTAATVPTSTTSTSTSTSSSSSTTEATATSTTSTVPTGVFGLPVGAEVTSATGPEAAYALAAAQRGDPRQVASAGSPAWFYLQWLRLAEPSGAGGVTATADAFGVAADRAVTLSGFVVADGVVSSFTECADTVCQPIDAAVLMADPACQPAPGCPHLRSDGGEVMAFQRASLTWRWPTQILLYELVVTSDRTIVAVHEPNGRVHYDAATSYLVAVFPDQPVPGTRDDLTITFTDGSSDVVTVFYG
jgi:hypothetical protein